MLSYDHYFSPTTLAAAFDALERVPGARLVAGATDLLPWARDGRAGDVHLPALVDVSGIAALRGVTRVGAGRLSIGAATPIAAFEHDPLLVAHAPVLARCAVWFADHQIREQATVGGNLVNASPAGDTLPALLVLNTHVTLARFEAGAIRERTVPLSEFMLGPGKTVCHAGEIMTRIEIDALGDYGSAFEKVGHRRSLVISTVCLAAVAKLSADQSRLDDLRIAIAAVGPVPERLADLEDLLIGQTPTPRALRDAALRVAERVRSRSRQTYRREVLVNLVERGLVEALAGAGLKIERLPKETSHV
jgi:CO/xanthine dehydrogenase FAD-binding subunit